MLEKFVDYPIVTYAMVLVTTIGVLGKIITRSTIKHMIKEAENIHTSEHRLMKLIKAKYEHANMLVDRVKNVGVFVDKYLFEYRVGGISLYAWQMLPIRCMWLVIALAFVGAGAHYMVHGICEEVFRLFVYAGICSMVLFLLRAMSSENRTVSAVRTYIVDYLENVCAHRYAKMCENEKEEKITEQDLQAEMQAAVEEEEKKIEVSASNEDEEKRRSQELMIREILEEFLA